MRQPGLIVALAERLEGSSVPDFIAHVQQLDPDLNRLDHPQRTRFFRAWALKGDPQTLAAGMASHPAWQGLGWRWWAEACGRGGTPDAWQQACRIVSPRVPRPDVPPISDQRPVAQLQRDASAAPDDPALALALYHAQHTAGDFAGSLTTLRRITRHPENPAYFLYLEASTAMEAGQWKAGWEAWERYFALVPVNG